MKKYIYLAVILMMATTTYSQNKKKKTEDKVEKKTEKKLEKKEVVDNEPIRKIEIDYDYNIPEYELASLGEKGLFLITKEDKQSTLSIYDADLNKKYSQNIEVPKGQVYIKHVFADNKIFFLFANENYFLKFNIVTFDLETKKQSATEGEFQHRFNCVKLDYLDGKVYMFGDKALSGWSKTGRYCLNISSCCILSLFGVMNYPNWVYMATIDTKKNEVSIEEIDYGKKPHVTLMSSDLNEEKKVANILVKESISKKETNLYIQTIDLAKNNAQKDKITIDVGEGYEAYSAKVNYSDNDQRLVFGTYGGKTAKFLGGARFPKTKGVFIAKLDKNKVSWTKNIFYSQIYRNSAGKESSNLSEGNGYMNEILFHDVIESENGYIFIGESYYPTFHTEYTTDANGRTTTRQVFDGYVTDKCVVFSTDRKGTYKWSSTFYLPYYRTFNLGRKLVTVNANNDKLVLTCLKKGQISTYYIEDNGFKSDEEVSAVTTLKKGEKLRRANNNIVLWYDNYYVAFGDVKITFKKKDENGKKSRNYLYIYKMQIGGELKNEEEEE